MTIMRSMLVGGLVAATLLSGCGDNVQVTTLLWYRAPCSGPFLHLCPVERTVDGQIYYVYDGLLGYEPVWGVEADIEYREEGADTSYADAVGTRHVERVVATRPVAVGEIARWGLGYGESYFTAAGDHVEAFGTAVACEPAVCAQLTTIEPTTRRVIDLEYTGDPAIPLRALVITAR